MKTYPIMLVARDRLAVVVGAGGVGMRKLRSLLAAGAKVRLVSQDLPGGEVPDGVELVVAPYRPEHVDAAALVFACTDDAALNARIAADARRAGALVNAADQPADCDFFVPAVVTNGDVTVAIGTGGASPALAAMLKRRVREALGQRMGEYAEALGALRGELKEAVPDVARRGEIMRRLASEESLRVFLDAGAEGLRRKMTELLRELGSR